MTIVTLTQAERNKFANWLEQEAKTNDLLAKQAEILPSGLLTKHLRTKAVACAIVAKELRSIEEMEISGGGTDPP